MLFCDRLRGAAAELEAQHPRMVQFFLDMGAEVPAFVSYLSQDWEGLSLAAKRSWAAMRGHSFFSAQHDGAPIGLCPGTTAEAAARELTAACSHALGYRQIVEVKPMVAQQVALGLMTRVENGQVSVKVCLSAQPQPFVCCPQIVLADQAVVQAAGTRTQRRALLDLVAAESFRRQRLSLARPRRSLVISGYVHRCIERLHQSRILQSAEVMQTVPQRSSAQWRQPGTMGTMTLPSIMTTTKMRMRWKTRSTRGSCGIC